MRNCGKVKWMFKNNVSGEAFPAIGSGDIYLGIGSAVGSI